MNATSREVAREMAVARRVVGDVNSCFWSGAPLHFAVRVYTLPVVRALIEAGANVDFQDGFQNTPLHYAVVTSSDKVRLLIEAGANPNIRNHDGRTPLVNASSIKAAKMLIDAGAQVDERARQNPRVANVLWRLTEREARAQRRVLRKAPVVAGKPRRRA